MDNNDQALTGNDKDRQEHKAKDEIPSWLQGLDEPYTEGTSSEEKENIQSEDHWVKDAADSIIEPSNQQEEEDQTRSNHIEDLNVNEQDYQPEQDDFVEISDLVTNTGDDELQGLEDETLTDNEELPKWLHEMIAEEPETPFEDTIPSVVEEQEDALSGQPSMDEAVEVKEQTDEPTEPIDITQETPVEQEEPPIEIPTITFEREEPFPEIDEGTDDLSVTVEEQEEQEPETPKTLRFAQFLLKQGDYNQAINIINTYIDKPEYLEEINDLLTDAVNDGADQNSAVWETLGDIALNKGDSEKAIRAYTKAINILLGRVEGNHETD